MPKTLPDAASDLRQYLDRLPNVASLRERLRQHRDEGKLLRRLLRLAADAEAATNGTGRLAMRDASTAQPRLDVVAGRETIQRLIDESDGKLMRGNDPRLLKREASSHAD